jgi:hypothetical protein
MKPLLNKPVTRVASHCLSVVDCCRSENMVYTFAMLLAFAPLTTICHTLGRDASKTKRAKFVIVLVNRAAECGLHPFNEKEYGR